MTDQEILNWIGVTDPRTQVMPYIAEGMRDVPVPASAGDQLDVLRAFLKVYDKDKGAVFIPGTSEVS